MPRAITHKSTRKGGIRVMLATPAYAGLSASYVQSLFSSLEKLLDEGINADLLLLTENCHVDDGRNIIVRDFLETDCESLVFLDTDVSWSADDLVKLIKHDRDIVAGIYPLKEHDEGYPVRMFPGDQYAEEDGLLEVEGVPTGFLKIKREVLETLSKIYPGFHGKADNHNSRKISIIFERTIEGSNRWGGDYTFCRRARAIGKRIFVDPEMRFEHYGEYTWSGRLGDYLRESNNILNPHVINALKDINSKSLIEAFNHWGNSWAASPSVLMSAYEIARESRKVFECGSGLSTLVMGLAGAEVTAFESDYLWYRKLSMYIDNIGLTNVNLIYSPLKDYGDFVWYSDAPTEFDFALVDGPVRAIGREGFYRLANYENATLLIDDCLYPEDENHQAHHFDGKRPFTVMTPKVKKCA